MAQLTVISHEKHAGKRWKRYSSYDFAAQDALAPVVAQEVSRACLCLPLGFMKTEDAYHLVAIQGLKPGVNLLVNQEGNWVGGYVPAAYRAYPFVLANTEDRRRVLCVVTDNDLINDSEGEPFFDEEGEPSSAVKSALKFLEQVWVNTQITNQLCDTLAEHGLIKPWNVHIKSAKGDQKLEGLYCIDEAALNALPAEGLGAVRDAGAMPLAYCQLLSMQHLHLLARFAGHREAVEAMVEPESGELNLEFLSESENIRFT